LPSPVDFAQHFGAVSSPQVTLGSQIVASKIGVDGLNQVSEALKASVEDGLLGEIPKESFHHLKPGSSGGCKMQVKASMARQPGFERLSTPFKFNLLPAQ
jgi:hypothetical protein